MSSHGLCQSCGRLKRLDEAGTVAFHHLTIPVSAKAIHAAGGRRVRRRCPGSGRPPRRVEP
jgi:hypothetical protein